MVSKSQVSGRQQAAAVTADSDLDQGRPIKWPRAAQLLAAGTWGAVGGRAELLALLMNGSTAPAERPGAVSPAKPKPAERFAAIRVNQERAAKLPGLLVGEALFTHLAAQHQDVDLTLVDPVDGSMALVRGETPRTETPIGLDLLGRGKGVEAEASAALFRHHRFAVVVSEGMSGAILTEDTISAVVAGAIPVVVGLADEPPDADQVGSSRYVYCQFDAAPAQEALLGVDATAGGSLAPAVDAFMKDQTGRLAACLAKIEGHRSGPDAFWLAADGVMFDMDKIGRRIRGRLIDTYANPYPHLTGKH